jgi:ribokinase
MARIVVLGSSNTDMTVRLTRLPAPGETLLGGEFATGPGGKGANQAIAARRAGAEVTFLTAVGDDVLGRQALEHYGREGVDVDQARVIAGVSSGVALILVGEAGENMIGVAPGANGDLTAGDIERLPDALFTSATLFLASLEIPVEAVVQGLRRARAHGMITMINPAPSQPAIVEQEVLSLIDVLTPNEAEALALSGLTRQAESQDRLMEAALGLRTRGVRNVVITVGSEGCLVVTEDGCKRVPAPVVEVVDTVGAGDAFNGALAVALAERQPLFEAASWACAAAALAVTRPGAQGALPYRQQIDRLAGAP